MFIMADNERRPDDEEQEDEEEIDDRVSPLFSTIRALRNFRATRL